MLQAHTFSESLGKLRQAESLADVLQKAENYCKDCAVSSPMVCVERCQVWRVKHEILETRRVVDESNHRRRLLNVLKNSRRLRTLEALCERSRSVRELQRDMRQSGFRHSRRTIVEAYLKPMMHVGLISGDGVRFEVTFYGRNIHDLLAGLGWRSLGSMLPIHSCCYEEVVLKELDKPETFNELAAHVPQKAYPES